MTTHDRHPPAAAAAAAGGLPLIWRTPLRHPDDVARHRGIQRVAARYGPLPGLSGVDPAVTYVCVENLSTGRVATTLTYEKTAPQRKQAPGPSALNGGTYEPRGEFSLWISEVDVIPSQMRVAACQKITPVDIE